MSDISFDDTEEPRSAEAAEETEAETTDSQPTWRDFVRLSKLPDIRKRFVTHSRAILEKHKDLADNYCILTIFDPGGGIGGYEADRTFAALSDVNLDSKKDVLLLLLSRGGNIEPAYQISKLCKRYARDRFVVAIPRYAKSAATLVAIGADEIHIGPLGELGPIDPQLGGLPALGVQQALQRIASLSEKFPGSSQMFAQYLQRALTVEQIGYCERIAESAVQYAERLLSTKENLESTPQEIAKLLVYVYKDHGFVIDADEAQRCLGSGWLKTESSELELAEDFYQLFDEVDLCLTMLRERRLVVIGEFGTDPLLMKMKLRRRE